MRQRPKADLAPNTRSAGDDLGLAGQDAEWRVTIPRVDATPVDKFQGYV